MVIAYLCRFKTVKLTLKALVPSPEHCRAILSLGMAPCFNQLAMMIVQIVMNNILRYYGAQSNYGSEIPLSLIHICSAGSGWWRRDGSPEISHPPRLPAGKRVPGCQ